MRQPGGARLGQSFPTLELVGDLPPGNNIIGRVGLTPTGQVLAAASTSVVLASDQPAIPISGTITVTGGLTDTQLRATAVPVSGTVAVTGVSTSALQTTGNSSLSSIDGKAPALGQALAAASVPVVLTAAQITTLTPPVALTGFATSALQTTGNASLTSIDGKITAVNTGAVTVIGTVGLTDAQLRAVAVPVSLAGSIAVTGAYQTIQPVSLLADNPVRPLDLIMLDTLTAILTELKVVSTLLQIGLTVGTEPDDIRAGFEMSIN